MDRLFYLADSTRIMMRRIPFLLLALGVTASCSTLERFIPSHYPEGQPIYIGSSPCALPCFYGITPGETPETRALVYIASLPKNQIIDSMNFWIPGNDQNKIYVDVRRYDPREPDIVDTVELDTHYVSALLSLGQFIGSGWIPTHVYRIRASLGIVLLLVFGDSGQIIATVADDSSINANSPIVSLLLVPAPTSEYYLNYFRGVWLFDDEIRWLGYASANDYWAEAPIR